LPPFTNYTLIIYIEDLSGNLYAGSPIITNVTTNGFFYFVNYQIINFMLYLLDTGEQPISVYLKVSTPSKIN